MPAGPGHVGHLLWLTVQLARPPFVLVGRSATGADKKVRPVGRADRNRARLDPGPLDPSQSRQADRPGHVEHVEDAARGQHDIGLRMCEPPSAHELRVGAGLQPPGGRDRMRARRGAANPVTRAGPARGRRPLAAPGYECARAHRPAHRGVADGGIGHAVRCATAAAPQCGIDQLASLPPGCPGIDSHWSPGTGSHQATRPGPGAGTAPLCNVCRATTTTSTLAEPGGSPMAATPHLPGRLPRSARPDFMLRAHRGVMFSWRQLS